jgi:hypothetical protein
VPVVVEDGADMIRKLALVAFVVIGILVAGAHHYFTHLEGIKGAASAALAVILWPLVLVGVNLHIH